MKLKSTILILLLQVLVNFIQAQSNVITTAVPFLNICPDARSTSLGWSGAATSPDIYSQSQNPAKYAFFYPKKNLLSDWNYKFLYKQDTCKKDSVFKIFKENIRVYLNRTDFKCIDSTTISDNFSLALSYTPWYRNLLNGMNLAYLVGYKRLDDHQTLSASLRYFTLGSIQFMSEYGDALGELRPKEFAVDLSYSRLLTENFSGAIAFRYIRSDLTAGQMVNGVATHAGTSYAADMAFYYMKKFSAGINNKVFSAGLYVSNIGNKISYGNGYTKDFIPTNMKLGIAYSTEINKQNSITISLDANKLLVPNQKDTTSGVGYNKSVGAGIFSSFSDAPGGFSEELKEIHLSGGIEYTYQQNYFLRAGYSNENVMNGNHRFFSMGIGLNIIIGKCLLIVNVANIKSIDQNDPIDNTKQLSVSFTL